MKKDAKDIDSPKGKYIQQQTAEIVKWNAELEDLEAQVKSAKIDAKAKVEHDHHVLDLRKKCDDAKKKLSEIQHTDNETWEDLKSGLESIWTSVNDGFKKAKAKVS